MKLFAGSSNIPLAEKVASNLHVSLSPVDVHIFPDGERRIRIAERVVGEHVYVLQPANTPVDTNYMELFFLIDALKRSGAEFVTAIVPYFGYQRQDHLFREGEAVSLEVVVSILEKLGIDRLISIDMHSPKIPDLFSVPVSHMSALPLFAKEIRALVISSSLEKDEKSRSTELGEKDPSLRTTDWVLVSPDMGGITRIRKLAELLGGMDYVAVEKHRDLTTGKITMDGVSGSLAGKKRAVLVDDMLSSGNTTILAAERLLSEGIAEIYAFATHAIFSENAPKKLQESDITKVFVTDTVHILEDKQFAKLNILSVADIIGQEIQRIEDGK